MASCQTEQFGGSNSSYCPVVKLTVTTSGGSSTNSTCTVSWSLDYVTFGYTWETSATKAVTAIVDGKTVYSNNITVGGKTTYNIDSGSFTADRGTGGASRTISFSVSINYGSAQWNDVTGGTRSGSGTVSTPNILYTYTISFDANGGSGAPGSQTKTYGTALTLSSTKPTRSGYTFTGWGTSSSGSVVYSAGASYTSNAAATLYAIWDENILTMNYYSNYATAYGGTYEASNTVNNNNVLVYTRTYYYDNDCENGLLNYVESDSSIYMYRTGYTATGKWGTSTSGGTLVDQDDTSLNTGQKIAEAFGKDLTSGDASINVYAQWEENCLTIDYYSNYADYGTYQGDPLAVSGNSNVLVYSKTYYYDDAYEDGLNNIQNQNYLYLSRTGYFSTGYWGTTSNGGTLINETDSFATGQALAEAFGLSLKNGNESVVVYAQWEPANVAYYNNNGTYVLCNTYGKVNGSWQPMLFYGKIDGTWQRSVVEE